jgi:hypothetical protein
MAKRLRRFIAARLSCWLRGVDGRLDFPKRRSLVSCSLDEKTLVPDRVGNNQLDAFDNLLANPEIGCCS